MSRSDQEIETVVKSWTVEVLPSPPPASSSRRTLIADSCMASRRIIDLIAAGGGTLEKALTSLGPSLGTSAAGEPSGGEGAGLANDERRIELDDDVQGGTQGWMFALVPPLLLHQTERVYLADLACAMRRLLELVLPQGASVDGNGHLVLPKPVDP